MGRKNQKNQNIGGQFLSKTPGCFCHQRRLQSQNRLRKIVLRHGAKQISFCHYRFNRGGNCFCPRGQSKRKYGADKLERRNYLQKLDGFLILNDKEILQDAGNVSRLEMEKKVRNELEKYNQKKLKDKN